MEQRPKGFDDEDVRSALSHHHGIDARELRYRPVGFGDYHWAVTGADGSRWFAKISDLTDKPQCGHTPAAALDGYRAALRTAAELRAAGLEFVLAPVPPGGGEIVTDLDGRWALAVFEHVDAPAQEFHTELSPGGRDAVLALLARLHAAAAPAVTPRHSPTVPDRNLIEEALAEQEVSWSGGPFSEPARQAVVTHANAIRARLAEADALTHQLTTSGRPAVVTHGEPHPGNLLDVGEGYLLIDWDTVGLGVPERDLAVVSDDPAELAAYTELTGVRPDPVALELYGLRWTLADLGEFLRWFRAPHSDDADSRTAWEGLLQTLAALDR
ncbi:MULTISPECIES: phosphotransferase family protein [Pseudonocardia]|uniref:Phosphotransferase enzyme family protein n=2 Tax=Pseudonocardia TaxID=1847 RepID=A0A1Y2N782_PSEAH|nr:MULTISPECIES: phosphotransferase [Pseudonocardia]OSY42748.1 Phosphotransferase enzyme family protein [Pseudonocardia autotrophica]TDN77325.1 spectinomycin phosphotransferase [Pseudonocardia autotrophica]